MADGSIVIDVNANTGKASKELVKLQNQMAKLEQSANKNSAKKSAIEEQMKAAQASIDETKAKLDELRGQEERFKELSKGTRTKSQQMEYMDLYSGRAERLSNIKALSVQYDSQLKGYESMKNKAQQLTIEEQSLNDQLERQKGLIGNQLANDARKSTGAMQQFSRGAKDDIAEASAQASRATPNFKKLFRTILKYGLGVRSVYILFRKLKQVVKESFSQLAKSDKETEANLLSFRRALSELKGSFGAAFAPIMNAIIPYLNRLISWLSSAANAVQRFFAVLSGKTAIKKAVSNINSIGQAAGDAKKQLMGFDELNILDSGGGGGGADYDYIDEAIDGTSKIAQIAQKLRDITMEWVKTLDVDKITAAWNSLKETFGKLVDVLVSGLLWSYENILLPIAKWVIETALPLILRVISFIGDLVASVLQCQGVVNAFHEIWEGLKTFVEGALTMIYGLLSMFWSYEADEIFLKGLIKFADGGKQIIMGLWNGIKAGWEVVKKKIADVWDSIVNGFKSFFGIHSPSKLMEELGMYLIEGLFNGLNTIGDSFATWWDDKVKPWFTLDKWKELGSTAIKGIKDGLNSMRLPKFHFSWSSEGYTGTFFGKSFTVNIPYPNLSFYARGGIVNRASLFGSNVIGEDGQEAIIPLENHTEWITKVADKLLDAMQKNPLPAMANGFVVPPNATSGLNDIMQAINGLKASLDSFSDRGISIDVVGKTYLDGRELTASVTRYQRLDSRAKGY